MTQRYHFASKKILTFLLVIFLCACAVRDVTLMSSTETELNLNKKELGEIPREVFKNKQLRVLRLFKNNLHQIPSEIADLQELEELYIGKNQLRTLPKEKGN